jgi:hypothetical protein
LGPNKPAAEAVETRKGGTLTLGFPALGDPSVVRHAVSTRLGGVSEGSLKSLNISYKVGDEPSRVRKNRRSLSRSTGLDLEAAVFLTQVHSDKVLQLTKANRPPKGEPLGDADALITDVTGIPILIMVADCLPILFFDPIHRAVGLAHAGWRGTAAGIAEKTLKAMGGAFGSRPGDVRAILGPAIGSCCYEVGKDVHDAFASTFPWGGEMLTPSCRDHWMLDIPGANARQLLEAGITEDHLIRSGLCTVQHIDKFFSHRAEASEGKATGRFGAMMMLMEKDI